MAKRGHKPGVPRPDEQIQSEPGQNSEDVRAMYALMKQPRCDMSDSDAVAERYDWYVQHCIENDERPTVAGMALAFGYSRDWLLDMKNGNVKSVSQQSIDTLKRAWDALNYLIEKYMVEGRINPAPGIFLMKNNFGYKDVVETVQVKKDPYETGDPEEIARKYLSGMAPAIDAPQENAPIVETVVIDQTGTVE